MEKHKRYPFLTGIVKYVIMNMSKKLAYNKKGIPSFDELGTIPKIIVLIPTYTVGTIFIKMTKITIIRSIMIVQRYLSFFPIKFHLPLLKVKGNST